MAGISLGNIIGLGGAFIKGPWGKVVSGLGALAGSGGADNGGRYSREAEEARKKQIETILAGNKEFDDFIRQQDLSPDKAVNALHEYADYYTKLLSKNAAADTAVHRMFRSTDPGVQLANQGQLAANDFAEKEQGLRDSTLARLLGVEGQRLSNKDYLASAYGSQVPGLVDQGNTMRREYNLNMSNGLQGLMGVLKDPEISKWLAGGNRSGTSPTTNPYPNLGPPPAFTYQPPQGPFTVSLPVSSFNPIKPPSYDYTVPKTQTKWGSF